MKSKSDRPSPGLPSLLIVIGLLMAGRTIGEARFVDPASTPAIVYDETGQVVEPRDRVLFAPQGRVLNPAVRSRESGIAIFTTGVAAAALRRFVPRSRRARTDGTTSWRTPSSRAALLVAANLSWLTLAAAQRAWWAYGAWRDDTVVVEETRLALSTSLWLGLPLINFAVWLATRGLWLPVPLVYSPRRLRGLLASVLLLPIFLLCATALFASAWVGDFFGAPVFVGAGYVALATWAAAAWPRPRQQRHPVDPAPAEPAGAA